MNEIFILRHAKSSWDNTNLSDFERPLAKRGIKDAKKLKVPFGFKINAFEHIPPGWKPDSNNRKVQLGKRKDLTPKKFFEICKRLKNKGAKIIGGCCEITPKHIKYLNRLK